MVYVLPTHKGYTVDRRLKEFRKINRRNGTIEFIPFDSPKGVGLLKAMSRSEYHKVVCTLEGYCEC